MATIDKRKIDVNHDGRISNDEWDQYWKLNESKSKSTGTSQQRTAYAQSSQSNAASKAASVASARSPYDQGLESIVKELNALQKQLSQATDQVAKEMLKEKIQQALVRAEQLNSQASRKVNLNSYKSAAGMNLRDVSSKSMSVRGGSASSTPNAMAARSRESQLSSHQVKAFTAPAGWGVKSQSLPQQSQAFMNALMAEDQVAQNFDAINQNTKSGKNLMLLFYKLSKMAESGDMGAIYQFMKFITYIISKDKAKQQIEMGKKLIQLQELSRKWTNKLLDVQADSADPSNSDELMKTMTLVKSETDAIATSQKLISQMMEEFAQIVETLTNTTKGALETQGRIQRTVSTMR